MKQRFAKYILDPKDPKSMVTTAEHEGNVGSHGRRDEFPMKFLHPTPSQ